MAPVSIEFLNLYTKRTSPVNFFWHAGPPPTGFYKQIKGGEYNGVKKVYLSYYFLGLRPI